MSVYFRSYPDFFPKKIQTGLTTILQNSTVRRIEYDLSTDQYPNAVDLAKKFASDRLSLQFNFAVLKWYRKNDRYQSGAHQFHIDPPNFRSIPLVLHTVSGFADFEYVDGDEIVKVECQPNQTIVLSSDAKHRVSQPKGSSGERFFFYLGYKD